jgi:hypothetical protein
LAGDDSAGRLYRHADQAPYDRAADAEDEDHQQQHALSFDHGTSWEKRNK